MARVYADVNALSGPKWYDYDRMEIQWNEPSRYEIIRRVGGGKYSEVFEGTDILNDETCAIKVLKPVSEKKIKREIKVLRNISGGPNIVALLDVVRDPSHAYHSLVMEYVNNTDWKVLLRSMNELDMKYYLFQLLKALDFVHSRGIIHRDVKPGNVMIDVTTRKLRLIDWGLAEFYHPGTEYHIRVGSRYYKGPELLVGYKRYDYSLDMWSVGCMLASLIFRREHFFRGSDNVDQLLKILKVLGTEEFDKYMEKYDIEMETDSDALLRAWPRQPWTRYTTPDTLPFFTQESIDLLEKLLRYDHQERLTAREAQAHAYFNVVRLEATGNPGDCVSDSGFYST